MFILHVDGGDFTSGRCRCSAPVGRCTSVCTTEAVLNCGLDTATEIMKCLRLSQLVFAVLFAFFVLHRECAYGFYLFAYGFRLCRDHSKFGAYFADLLSESKNYVRQRILDFARI